jgi:hypothetical protein
MSSQTPRRGLIIDSVQDQFSVDNIAANLAAIDNAPGEFICTSTSRPSWGPQNAGQSISEIDTGLSWKWDGAQFIRRSGGGGGLLSTASASPAFTSQAVSVTTNSYPPSYVPLVGISQVVVPPGLRPLRITANVTASGSIAPTWFFGIFRSLYGNSGVLEREWIMNGKSMNSTYNYYDYYRRVSGLTLSTIIPGGLPAGTYDWSVQVRNVDFYPVKMYAETTMNVASNSGPGSGLAPCQIYVEEL